MKKLFQKEISDQGIVQNRPLQVVNKLPTMTKDARVSGCFFPTFAQIIR